MFIHPEFRIGQPNVAVRVVAGKELIFFVEAPKELGFPNAPWDREEEETIFPRVLKRIDSFSST